MATMDVNDDMTTSDPSPEHVGIAFALVFGAGSATAIGASVVFIPQLIQYANPTTLACGLGISAGVMIYVSFIEIIQKSKTAFMDAHYEPNIAYAYSTLCFFAGVVIMITLNACVSYFLHHHNHNHAHLPNECHDGHHHHQHTSDDTTSGGEGNAGTGRVTNNPLRQRSKRRPFGSPSKNTSSSTTRTTTTSISRESMVQPQIIEEPIMEEDVGMVVDDDNDDDEDENPCDHHHHHNHPTTTISATPLCCSDNPIRDLQRLHQMSTSIIKKQSQVQIQDHDHQQDHEHDQVPHEHHGHCCHHHHDNAIAADHDGIHFDHVTNSYKTTIADNGDVMKTITSMSDRHHNEGSVHSNDDDDDDEEAMTMTDEQRRVMEEEQKKLEDEQRKKKQLVQTSMNTAIAIGLHNFPEGLATFVATLHDPTVGAVLAIAIAIHNIPEGLCVALPIYYATGKRCTAFTWAIMSGLSEPFAAVMGYIVLSKRFTPLTYGILFGIVSGMMVVISIRELIPTAHRYDPSDRYVTYCVIIGMAIMALSLVLFVF